MQFDEDYKTVSLIYGDTDSLYSEWGSLGHTIKGWEEMPHDEKLRIVLEINQGFLDKHNYEYISNYYAQRHAQSVHEFELETVGYGGFWLDVKKKYAQLLAFKDGMVYDKDSFPLKIKGLEIVKSSTPALARDQLKRLVRYFLELDNDRNTIFKLNIKMQELWKEWQTAPVESISESIKVNNYTKFIQNDTTEMKFIQGTQGHYKGCCFYNYLINKYNLPAEKVYGGKLKMYYVDTNKIKGPAPQPAKNKQVRQNPQVPAAKEVPMPEFQEYFTYPAKTYTQWMSTYAPIDRKRMFQKDVLDPFNRILEAMNMTKLTIDGYVQMSLDLF